LSVIGTTLDNSTKGAEGEPARQITCTGKVTDAAGEPVADAKVKLHKLTVDSEAFTYDMALAQEVSTNDDGAFTLKTEASQDEMSGQTIILVEKDGLALGWANWVLGEDLDVEIKLDRPQVMAGKVIDDAGKPIPDAEVSIAFMIVMSQGQPQYLVSAESLEPLNTRSDAEGKFSFDRIPPDATAEFMVKKPTKATVSTFNPENYRGQSLQYSSGQTDIKIILPLEARIEGTVVEKATGKPASGIRIMATKGRNQPNLGLKPTVSGKDGGFTIDALDGGTYTLRIVTPAQKEAEWISEPVEVVTETGKTQSGVKVELIKGGLIEVTITDAATKKPVQQARISIRQQDRDEHFGAVSDEKGIAKMRLIPGEYQLTGIYRDGYTRQSQQETITIQDGQTTRLEQQLTGQPKISGVVRDEQGNPVKGAKLQVCPMGTGQDVVSDAEGKFEISWDPGRWHSSETPAMVLVARYEQGNLAAVVDVDEDTQTKDIALRPALTIVGKVANPDGKGITNAQITPMLRGPRWGASISRSQATTDDDGRFEIKALPTENSYTIYTRAEGYGENRSKEINSDDAVNNRIDAGSITLAVADLSVSGLIVDNDDKPVVGVSVYCYGDNQPHRRAQSDANGKFTLVGVCAGKIRISANKSGPTRLYGNVETEGGATDVKIVISERGSSARYVPKRPPSLVGKPLPDLKKVKIDLPQADLTGKMLLVCFFDMQQRPSRHCLRQLNSKTQELETKNIVVVGAQASKMDEDSLNDWCKKCDVSFPVGLIQGEEEESRLTWGLKSLPWLILT
ncbi:MAG: carboxypeptidase regulatory-like domain-containing protein, partial [Phycisphaerales bacterium]